MFYLLTSIIYMLVPPPQKKKKNWIQKLDFGDFLTLAVQICLIVHILIALNEQA